MNIVSVKYKKVNFNFNIKDCDNEDSKWIMLFYVRTC